MSVASGMKGTTVRTYRWRDQQASEVAKRYGLYDPSPPEPEKAADSSEVVADLVKRITTLQIAKRAVKVLVDGDFIVLGTEVPDDAPVVQTPAPTILNNAGEKVATKKGRAKVRRLRPSSGGAK